MRKHSTGNWSWLMSRRPASKLTSLTRSATWARSSADNEANSGIPSKRAGSIQPLLDLAGPPDPLSARLASQAQLSSRNERSDPALSYVRACPPAAALPRRLQPGRGRDRDRARPRLSGLVAD